MPIIWGSKGNAYVAAATRDAAMLSRLDAQTVAFAHINDALFHATGFDQVGDLAGGDWPGWINSAWFGSFNKDNPLTRNDTAYMERICMLFLEILKDPQDITQRAQAGLWLSLNWTIASRPELALKLIEAGMFELAIKCLSSFSPADWLSWRTPTGVLSSAIWMQAWAFSVTLFPENLEVNKAQLILEKGFVEIAMVAMKEFEKRGPDMVSESCVMTVWAPFAMIASCDLAGPEASPIVRMLEEIPSALRFVMDNEVSHVRQMGMTSSADCMRVCAQVFGKREDSGGDHFEFAQEQIDISVDYILTAFSGSLSFLNPVLPTTFFKYWCNLCISDCNKSLLIKSPQFFKMLVEVLLLDPEHQRQNQAPNVKAQIQCDAAECFAQMSLWDTARDILQAEPMVLAALHSLVNQGSTHEAKQFAMTALARLEPHAVPIRAVGAENLHVMMSCECFQHLCRHMSLISEGTFITWLSSVTSLLLADSWNVQSTVSRIVAELQRRKYLVWFDLEKMQVRSWLR
eukprot:SAG31_NODE_440_length_15664_cov_8.209252_10_plen_516_part_00